MKTKSKQELMNVVSSAVKDFINAHSEALEKKWVDSVTETVTEQIYCHDISNESKKELRNGVRIAIKDFINTHPEALEKKWIESVTKRVTGQLYCHYVHNKIKDGKIPHSGSTIDGSISAKEIVKGMVCVNEG